MTSSSEGYGAKFDKASRATSRSQLSKASDTFVDRKSQQRAHNGSFGAISSSSSSSSSGGNNHSNQIKAVEAAEEMNFSNKRLLSETVAHTLHRYPNLKAVDLSRNKISVIPKGMPMRLVALDLSHNQFSTIGGMNRVSNLIEVKLTHNRISSMEGLSAAPKLQHVDLSHNRISAIHGTELLKDLRTLNLAHNTFKHLVNLRGLTFNLKLESLNLLHNDIICVKSYKTRVKQLIRSLVELDGEMLHSQTTPSYRQLHSPPKLQDSRLLLESATKEDVNNTTLIGSGGPPPQQQSSFSAADSSLQSNRGDRRSYYLNVTRGYTIESDDDDESDEEVDKSNIPWRNPPKVAPRWCIWKGKDVRIGDLAGDTKPEFHYAIDYNVAVNKLYADLEGLTPEEKRRGVSARTRWVSPDHARKTSTHLQSSPSSSASFKEGKGGIINHPLPIEYDPSLSLRNRSFWSPPLFPPSSSIHMDGTDHIQPPTSTYTPLRQSKLNQLTSMGPMSNNNNGGRNSGDNCNDGSSNNDNDGSAVSRNKKPSYNGVHDNNDTEAPDRDDLRSKTKIRDKQKEIELKLRQLNSIINQNDEGEGDINNTDVLGRDQRSQHQRHRLSRKTEDDSTVYSELDNSDPNDNQIESLSPVLAAISPISHANEESALTLNMKTPPPSKFRYDVEKSEMNDSNSDDADGNYAWISDDRDHDNSRDGQEVSSLEESVVTPNGKAIAHAIQELMKKKRNTLAVLNSARLNRKL